LHVNCTTILCTAIVFRKQHWWRDLTFQAKSLR
jgi:hypothetical protein